MTKEVSPALGDGEHHVALVHPEVRDLPAAERREVLEALHGLDEGEVPAGHHAGRPAFPRVRRRVGEPRLAPLLPEPAPDRVQLDAQAPGGAAPGEEQTPSALEAGDRQVPQLLGLPGSGPAVIGLHHVAVHVEEEREPGRDVVPGDLAQLSGAGVGGLGDQRPQVELTAVAQELLGSLASARGRHQSAISRQRSSTPSVFPSEATARRALDQDRHGASLHRRWWRARSGCPRAKRGGAVPRLARQESKGSSVLRPDGASTICPQLFLKRSTTNPQRAHSASTGCPHWIGGPGRSGSLEGGFRSLLDCPK